MKGWIWSYRLKRWEPLYPSSYNLQTGGATSPVWTYLSSGPPVKFTKKRRPTKPPMFSEG